MIWVELLDRPNAEQFAVEPQTEERDPGIEESVGIECVNTVRWHYASGEHQVFLQEPPHILALRIVGLDDESVHDPESTALPYLRSPNGSGASGASSP